MKLSIPVEVLKKMVELGCKNELILSVDQARSWGCEVIDSPFLEKEDIELLKQALTAEATNKKIASETATLVKKIALLESLDSRRGKPTSKPEIMAELLKDYFTESENHWVFRCKDNAPAVAYLVTKIVYEPAYERNETYHPATVNFIAVAHCRGQHVEISYDWPASSYGKGGCTVEALLESNNLFRETPELMEQYTKDAEKYHDIRTRLGHQFVATGTGVDYGERFDSTNRDERGWYSRGMKLSSTRVVMNDTFEEGKSLFIACPLWAKKSDVKDTPTRLPIHTFVVVFNLDLHSFARVHVTNLTEYRYDKTAEGKLVLSEDRKELIDMLVRTSEERSEDIIKGKSGGVILLLSGAPGTGKTLTAEVYSEFVRRPLYVVQCSQLGISADSLEKELRVVLERASRWNAVLLIDEADVYIHERGTDITQNAIVGVFLRVLEHYSGVLFMTTNRATIVDDAIMSRMIAHVKYEAPDYDDSVKLWQVLSKQYDVDIDDREIKQAITSLGTLSGRSIKNLLRLAKVMSKSRKEPVTVRLLKHVAKFQEVT